MTGKSIRCPHLDAHFDKAGVHVDERLVVAVKGLQALTRLVCLVMINDEMT